MAEDDVMSTAEAMMLRRFEDAYFAFEQEIGGMLDGMVTSELDCLARALPKARSARQVDVARLLKRRMPGKTMYV